MRERRRDKTRSSCVSGRGMQRLWSDGRLSRRPQYRHRTPLRISTISARSSTASDILVKARAFDLKFHARLPMCANPHQSPPSSSFSHRSSHRSPNASTVASGGDVDLRGGQRRYRSPKRTGDGRIFCSMPQSTTYVQREAR